MDRDTYNGLVTIQTLEDGPMEFDSWKADKRILLKDFKGWVEATYGVTF